MGRVYDIYRYAPEVAVDLLAMRRYVQDVDRPAFYDPSHRYHDPVPDAPPRSINFINGRMNADVALFVGPECEAFADRSARRWHMTHTSEDPRVWITRGARQVGWHAFTRSDYEVFDYNVGDTPLRYSVPVDIEAILTTLHGLRVEDLQANVRRAGARAEVQDHHRWEGPDIEELAESTAPRLLRTLRMFYQAAQEAGEIVVYVLR
jgi:hypothetical protein